MYRMWLFMCISWKSEESHANPCRKESLQMYRMWLSMHASWASEETHETPYSREKSYKCTECEYLCVQGGNSEESYENSYRRDILQMHRTWLIMHTSWAIEKTHENLYKKENLQMHRLWLYMHTSWVFEEIHENKRECY